MSDVRSFRDLVVWQKAMDFVDFAYDVADLLPTKERFVLCDQLRRSAIAIPSNIAEGSKRGTRADFRNFTRIALGSAAEAETQLLIVTRRYKNVDCQPALNTVTELEKMLTKMISTLGNPINSHT